MKGKQISGMDYQLAKELVPKFFEKTAKTYDITVLLTTFGKDKFWKKEIIKKIPKCESILDLACGTGILTLQIAKKFPQANIIGVDITESYLQVAHKKLAQIHKVSLLCHDAEKINLGKQFDCITASYLPKYCNPEILVKRCSTHLNLGGKIIFHDFAYPNGKLIRSLWDFYFVVLSIFGFFLPRWKEVFSSLPKLIRKTNWMEDYSKILKDQGFDVQGKYLTFGTSAILTAVKKI